MLNLLLLVVGMMMDVFSAILVVLPLIAPTADAYGVNPYHLGIIFLLNLEIGYLTPPVGLNLFIASFKFRVPVMTVVRSVLPFIGAMLVALALVTYIPSLTWVPEGKRTGTAGGLIQLAREALAESRAVKEVPLVGLDGKPVLDPQGVQVVKRMTECDALGDDLARGTCQRIFLDVTDCRTKPLDAKFTTIQECEAFAIGDWVCDEMDVGCPEEEEEEEEEEEDGE
jgi:hypothetical protein